MFSGLLAPTRQPGPAGVSTGANRCGSSIFPSVSQNWLIYGLFPCTMIRVLIMYVIYRAKIGWAMGQQLLVPRNSLHLLHLLHLSGRVSISTERHEAPHPAGVRHGND